MIQYLVSMEDIRVFKELFFKKNILLMSLIAFSYAPIASAATYNSVSVLRVSTSATGIQIWATDGCSLQPGTNYYVTTESGTDIAHYARLMSVALSAQASGKTISLSDNCTNNADRTTNTSTIIRQICVNEPPLDNVSC